MSDLKVLPASCTARFPDKPIAWLARGFYRAPHMKGRTCSITVYTANRGQETAEAAARTENPWMRVTEVSLWGLTVAPVRDEHTA